MSTRRAEAAARKTARAVAFRLATSDRFEQIVLKTAPLHRRVYRHAQRYVAGLDQNAAFSAVESLGRGGLSASIDLFGENVADPAQAERATSEYLSLAEALTAHPGTYVSLDCSHLGLDHDPGGCRRRVEAIARALPPGSRLQLGAEDSGRTDAILNVADAAAGEGLPVMVTVQANLRRSPADVERLAELGIPIRLVKGAYFESRHVAHAWGHETDTAYIELVERVVSLGIDHSVATHDPAILTRLLANRQRASIEFLFGVRPDGARRLAHDGHDVRIYVPFGPRWLRYYARRVAESIGA